MFDIKAESRHRLSYSLKLRRGLFTKISRSSAVAMQSMHCRHPVVVA
jgi:hypothetical protein